MLVIFGPSGATALFICLFISLFNRDNMKKNINKGALHQI